MSSRALRKLQREQELQKQLAAAKIEDEDEESEEEEELVPVKPQSTPKNAFDMLEEVQDDEDDDGEDGDEGGATLPDVDDSKQRSHPSQPLTQTPKPKKKKKKAKKKGKEKAEVQTPTSGNQSEDEVDRAMRELAIKDNERRRQDPNSSSDTGISFSAAEQEWYLNATKLLAIEQKHLNPLNEMRSLFGNVAVEESESRADPRHQRRRDVNQQGGVDLATALTGRYSVASKGKELGALATRRNCFTRGKEEWPLATSGGLGMEYASCQATYRCEKPYNILHNDTYKETQIEFRLAVEGMDPQRMMGMLSLTPYHIATLLQVSEIARHQGDHSVSGDLLERALYSYGKSVHSTFPMAMREGVARVPYNRPANRELHLAIWRYIRNLEMRGTWRTAFEWAKLLLQLDPQRDPCGITLMIDQFAIRGRCHQDLIELMDEDHWGVAWAHLPNIQITLSLAYLRLKEPKKARQQLAIAMHQYPYILAALASSLDISPIPESIWGKTPSTDAEKLHTELYIDRAKDLWNTPETSALLVEVAQTLPHYSSVTKDLPPPAKLEISLEEARHIMLLEIPTLIGTLPRNFTRMHTSNYDVLPPPTSLEDVGMDFITRAPNSNNANNNDAVNDLPTIAAAAQTAGSSIQAILGAASAIASVTGVTIHRALNYFVGNAPYPGNNAAATDETNNNPDDAQISDQDAMLRDIQAHFGVHEGIDHEAIQQAAIAAQNMQDEVDREHARDTGTETDAEQEQARETDEELEAVRQALRAERVAARLQYVHGGEDPGWNHEPRRDRNGAADEDDPDSMPELDDIPAAQSIMQQQQRGPRAAMVEEAADDDETDQERTMNSNPRNGLGNAVLRRIDSNEDAAASSTATAPVELPAAPIRPGAPTPRPPRQPEEASTPSLEDDPQRLQRWLLTTGYETLAGGSQSSDMELYVRRLRILRKPQQEWVLGMLAQRGADGKRVVEGVRGEMG